MNSHKILVSACLLGESVRYDGRDNRINSSFLDDLRAENRVVAACPEVLGGLSVPRSPATIEKRFPIEIIDLDRIDVTPEFVIGAETTLDIAKKHGVIAALMKAKSPSCGNEDIPSHSFSGRENSGAGLAAQELMKAGIPVFNENQITQLELFLNQYDSYQQEKTA